MSRLINRNMQIPNGITFHVPELDWRPRRFSSFNGIVDALYHLVQANPVLLSHYPSDRAGLADLVDQYNADICEQMGWGQYISELGGAPAASPFPSGQPRSSTTAPPLLPSQARPPILQRLGAVAEGADTLVQWIRDKKDACPEQLAHDRAAICVSCPMNGKGGLERYFTIPAANAIRKAYEKRTGMELSTPFDDKLGVCEACACPLPLKVHFKIEDLKVSLADDIIQKLDPRCWIPKELAAVS